MATDEQRRQQQKALIGIGVVVVVLLVSFIVVRTGSGDSDRGIDGGPPHVVLDPVGEELTLSNAFTGPADVSIFDTGTVIVYADVTAADPLGGPVLLSTTVEQEGAEPAAGDLIVVQGVEGTRYASPGRDGLVYSWPSGPDRLQILTAIGLPEAVLAAAAEGATGDNGDLTDDATPDGFTEMGRDTFTALTSFGRGFMLDGPGSGTLSFIDARLGTELVVSSGPGGRERVELLRPFLDDLRNVDIDGTLALAGIAEGSAAITWLLGDTVVRLTGLGYTLDELVVVAQGIRTSTDEEFAAIVGEFLATN